MVAVEAWNKGSHAGSATVSGLPSVAASWIAARGRQKFQWYLSFQHAIAPSAAARFIIARRRASRRVSSPRAAERSRATRFQSATGGACQKIAAVVWSAVRVVLLSAPIVFTSSKSFVYRALMSGLGPFERNCDGLSITNGFRFPTHASGSVAVELSGRHRPGSALRSTVNGARYPSFVRSASIAA